jgi:hypothetical protein
MEDHFDSDQKIADAYGLPFLFENDFVKEDIEISIKRVVSMNSIVTKWIEKNRKIPSGSPKASDEEKKMSIWLKVVMFYKDLILDPKDECKDERLSNNHTHKVCQHIIRNGNPDLLEDSQ